MATGSDLEVDLDLGLEDGHCSVVCPLPSPFFRTYCTLSFKYCNNGARVLPCCCGTFFSSLNAYRASDDQFSSALLLVPACVPVLRLVLCLRESL